MDKELQGKLVEILTSIQSGVGEAKDFALSQLPDIVQTYILWARVTSAVYLVLSVAFLIALGWWCVRLYRMSLKAKQFDDTILALTIFTAIFGGIAAVGAVIVFFTALDSAMLVWLSPKVWLLKELAHLVK